MFLAYYIPFSGGKKEFEKEGFLSYFFYKVVASIVLYRDVAQIRWRWLLIKVSEKEENISITVFTIDLSVLFDYLLIFFLDLIEHLWNHFRES